MRSGFRVVGAGVAALAAVALSGCGPRGEWRAGWAKEDLTPPFPAPLAGYGKREGRLSTGVRDPVVARALVLEAAGGRVAIVSCDLIGIPAELKAAAVRLMPVWARRDPARVLLCATHTHAGPGAASANPLIKLAVGDLDARMLPHLAARIAGAVRRADAGLVPVRLAVTSGELPGLARNRRRADGPVATRLGVLRVTPRRGPGVLVAHFAMHPTILPASWMAFSADFPGAFAARAEAGGYDLALYLNGALGDQAPVPVPGATATGAVDVTGRALADRALAIAAGPGRSLPARVSARARSIPLPPSTFAGLIPGAAALQALDLGGLLLFAVPGEPVGQAGLDFDRAAMELGYRDAWLVGLANDHLGYFDTPAGFALNSYESNLTFHGPGSWPAILDSVPELVTGHREGVRSREATRREIVARGSVTRRGGGRFLTVRGSPREMGLQHGTLLRDEIRGFLADFSGWLDRNLAPELAVRAGVFAPALEPLTPSVPARWWLAMKARELQPFIAPELRLEMAAVAEGAGVPYDQILLLNVFLTIAEQPDRERFLLTGPRGTCTNLVVLPARAAGETIVARNLDWAMGDVVSRRALVTLAEPDDGLPFATVGWAGCVGALTGLNAAGLAITEESIAAPRDTRYHGEPLPLLLRRVLQQARSVGDAVAAIAAARGTCGYHVTVVDGRAGTGRVLELSARRVAFRRPRDGLLPGVVPDRSREGWDGGPPPVSLPRSDASSDRRYAGVREFLAATPGSLDPAAARRLLRDRERGVCVPTSLHSVVLLPGRFAGWVAHGSIPAPEGAYEWFDFAAELRGTGREDAARARLAAAFGTTAYWDRLDDPVEPALVDREPPVPGRRYGVTAWTMPSAATSDAPGNDVLRIRLYEPRGPTYGSAVFLPMWKGRERDAEDVIARALAGRGLRIALMPMAYQWRRSPPGVRSGTLTFSADWPRTRAAVAQTAADAHRVARWLRARDPAGGGIGLIGLSLGGFVASAIFAVEPRFSAGVFVLAGGDAADALYGGARDVRAVREALDARGLTRADVRRELATLTPAALARPERGERVLLVNALFDRVVSPDNARRLREAWGEPAVLELPGDHHGVVVFLDAFLDRADAHLRRWLAEPAP